MAYEELKSLAGSYPRKDRDAFLELEKGYRTRKERAILELAALAADVSADNIMNLGLEPGSAPQLLEAFELQYPHQSVERLREATEGQLQGWANGVKGKYFELLVAEKLNAGETVGDIKLLSGEVAKLAESTTQAGWDLAIVDEAGETVEEVQLKATDSLGYVKDALEISRTFESLRPRSWRTQQQPISI